MRNIIVIGLVFLVAGVVVEVARRALRWFWFFRSRSRREEDVGHVAAKDLAGDVEDLGETEDQRRYLDKKIRCEIAGCLKRERPRRDFWELHHKFGIQIHFACDDCYFRIVRERPHRSPRARRAFWPIPYVDVVRFSITPSPFSAHRQTEEEDAVLMATGVDSKGNPVNPYHDLIRNLPDVSEKVVENWKKSR